MEKLKSWRISKKYLVFPILLLGIGLVLALTRINYGRLLAFYLTMCAVQGSLVSYAIWQDHGDRKLALVSLVDSLWYSHLISYVTVRAGISFLAGTKTSWNKLPRLGKNVALVTG